MYVGGKGLLDISAETSAEVELLDLSEREKAQLRQVTQHLYHNFTPTQPTPLLEKEGLPNNVLKLQLLFYRKCLEGVMEGIHLHPPVAGGPGGQQAPPIPEFFNLRTDISELEKECDIDDQPPPLPLPLPGDGDAISIASSIQDDAPPFIPPIQPDTISISSSVSSHAPFPGDVEAEADGEDENNIYEDISEICEKLELESANAAATVSEGSTKEPDKKASSILGFLKKRVKPGSTKAKKPSAGKKEKAAASSSPGTGVAGGSGTMPAMDLEFREEDEDYVEEEMPSAPLPPGAIPTESQSSSEGEAEGIEEKEIEDEDSYNEMGPGGPGNSGYLSDNYEDVGFQQEQSQAPSIPAAMEPPAPSLPATRSAKMKNLLQKAIIETVKTNAVPATKKGSQVSALVSELAEKKPGKVKENRMSATLPRKFKMAGPKLPLEMPSVVSSQSAAVSADQDELSKQVSILREEVDALKSQLSALTMTVEVLAAQGGRYGADTGETGDTGDTTEMNKEANLRKLKNMTLDQVVPSLPPSLPPSILPSLLLASPFLPLPFLLQSRPPLSL